MVDILSLEEEPEKKNCIWQSGLPFFFWSSACYMTEDMGTLNFRSLKISSMHGPSILTDRPILVSAL